MTQTVSLEKLTSLLNLPKELVVSVSIHNPKQTESQLFLKKSRILIVVNRRSQGMKVMKTRIDNTLTSTIIIDESLFVKDCVEEELGGAVAHLLLIPYTSLMGEEFLKNMESSYLKHIFMESIRNLVISYKLSSTLFILTPEYILYDKLKRLSTIYPLSRSYIKNLDRKSIEVILKKLEKTLDNLIHGGYLKKHGIGFSPTEKLIDEILRERTLIKTSEDFEHIFKLYVSTKQSTVLDVIKYATIDPSMLTIPKIPEPENHLYVLTSLGPQPFPTRLTIEEFVKGMEGVNAGSVKVRRVGGILNATYIVEFNRGAKLERIFIKKYLNWSDFKWVAAWLWALGVKNFSIMASTRMSNEIFFINKLAELGFNTAEILHINWKDKILFQKYIDGENAIQYIKNRGLEKAREVAEALGKVIAQLHSNNVTMGDCNPFSFIFGRDEKIYLTDLEQCSLKGSKPWDLAELILYTSRYLPESDVEGFAYAFSKAYLENGGDAQDLKESTLQKYIRLLTPLTPFWIQSRAIRGIQKILEGEKHIGKSTEWSFRAGAH